MIVLTGKYNKAKIFIDEVDETTQAQICGFLNHFAFADTDIAIMPDCHAGAGAVIGFTAKMNDFIIPNVVGVDIGCGLQAHCLGYINIDFPSLDTFIDNNIPSGFSIRNKYNIMPNNIYPSVALKDIESELMRIMEEIKQNEDRVIGSVGTLGGGNHFIEIGVDVAGQKWLFVHSGSRNFGLQVATFHQKKAKELLKLKFPGTEAYKNLEYLPKGAGFEEYLKDMEIAQKYAKINRDMISDIIIKGFFGNVGIIKTVDTVHNYISFKDNIIRKGAISAHEGEELIIPFNMRDGVIIGTGKGNKEWNFSAPHGAGRVMSRSKAKKELTVENFQKQMEGIYTTTANLSTLDESPEAYKNKDIIIEAIKDTITIETFVKPLYNFKSAE